MKIGDTCPDCKIDKLIDDPGCPGDNLYCDECGYTEKVKIPQAAPEAGSECMNLLSDRSKRLLVYAFKNGYEAGHDDTVESQYTDAEERGKDWLADAMEDGSLLDT